MTEVVALTVAAATGVVTAGVAIAAAVDPSVSNLVGLAIGAVVTITMGVIAFKTVALNKKVEAQSGVISQTLQKAAVIEGHVNSEQTKMAGEILALQQENRLLREVLNEKRETASLLAQAKATAPVQPVIPD